MVGDQEKENMPTTGKLECIPHPGMLFRGKDIRRALVRKGNIKVSLACPQISGQRPFCK